MTGLAKPTMGFDSQARDRILGTVPQSCQHQGMMYHSIYLICPPGTRSQGIVVAVRTRARERSNPEVCAGGFGSEPRADPGTQRLLSSELGHLVLLG